MLRFRLAVLAAAGLLFLASVPAEAQNRPAPAPAPRPAARDLGVQAFFGSFAGTGLAKTEDSAYFGVTVRDLDVKIESYGSGGFTTTWTTVVRQGGDPGRPRVRKRTTSLSFEPAAGRPGLFRGTETGDPLTGKTQTWARITRNTLLVHNLVINEEGAYEFETYSRTLSGSGMDLVYNRVRDGEQFRSVKGKLIKNAN